jgi:hypothetical protein
MTNPFPFRKESLQPASAASGNPGGGSPLKLDSRGGRPAANHGEASITITTTLTHTDWPN